MPTPEQSQALTSCQTGVFARGSLIANTLSRRRNEEGALRSFDSQKARFMVNGAIATLVLTTLLWIANSAAEEPAVVKPVQEMLTELHLLEPFWRSETVYRESVVFLQDGEGKPAVGKLLFHPKKVIAVHRANGTKAFEEGKDYAVDVAGGALIRQEGSAIPQLTAEGLFPPKDAPMSIRHKAGDPSRHVLFDNGHWFHDQQVEVTYVREGEWTGYVPQFAGKALPKTMARLKGKKPLNIAVSGDSISNGYNASAFTKAPPFMPPYPDLVAAQLEATYGSKVTLHNRAISGWNAPRGVQDLDNLLTTKPHLVIIAYGMNDVGGKNPTSYQASIRTMLDRIHAADPQTEVILVSTMLGNEQWVHTPREMFPKYRDALAELTGPGIALADLTAIWTDLLKQKREVDLTGNGVNHPDDFGHRVYAQVILGLLVEADKSNKE